VSRDDFRIFDSCGRVVAVLWHHGKNPYDAFDPLQTSNTIQAYDSKVQPWGAPATLLAVAAVHARSGGMRAEERGSCNSMTFL
jgi:hypothetical protein